MKRYLVHNGRSEVPSCLMRVGGGAGGGGGLGAKEERRLDSTQGYFQIF